MGRNQRWVCDGRVRVRENDVASPDWAAELSPYSGMDGVKAAGFLVENLTDPATSHSQEPSQAPFNRAFNTDLPFHMWLQEPANVLHLKRVQIAMRSMTGYASGDLPVGGTLLPAYSLSSPGADQTHP